MEQEPVSYLSIALGVCIGVILTLISFVLAALRHAKNSKKR
jgi:MFS superfamily sulfate permease-like transporter